MPSATPMRGFLSTCCRELMDHASVQTTMGYYRISLKRKQQAIRAVGSLAIDASGRPAPFMNPLAWERASVVGALRQLHRAFEHQSRR